jgi:hypothetical protein
MPPSATSEAPIIDCRSVPNQIRKARSLGLLYIFIEQEEAKLGIELGDSAKDLVGHEPNVASHKVKVASANDDGDGDDDIEDIDAQEKEIAAEVIGSNITHPEAAAHRAP